MLSLLRAPYEIAGTDIGRRHLPTRPVCGVRYSVLRWSMVLPYARPTRCPVLRQRMVLPVASRPPSGDALSAYALPMPCPVRTERMMLRASYASSSTGLAYGPIRVLRDVRHYWSSQPLVPSLPRSSSTKVPDTLSPYRTWPSLVLRWRRVICTGCAEGATQRAVPSVRCYTKPGTECADAATGLLPSVFACLSAPSAALTVRKVPIALRASYAMSGPGTAYAPSTAQRMVQRSPVCGTELAMCGHAHASGESAGGWMADGAQAISVPASYAMSGTEGRYVLREVRD
eukprot:3940391-Rhodomonas_salina.8